MNITVRVTVTNNDNGQFKESERTITVNDGRKSPMPPYDLMSLDCDQRDRFIAAAIGEANRSVMSGPWRIPT